MYGTMLNRGSRDSISISIFQSVEAGAAMFSFPPRCSVPQHFSLWLWLNFKPNWTELCEQGVEIPSSIFWPQHSEPSAEKIKMLYSFLPVTQLLVAFSEVFSWNYRYLLSALNDKMFARGKTNIWIKCFHQTTLAALLSSSSLVKCSACN